MSNVLQVLSPKHHILTKKLNVDSVYKASSQSRNPVLLITKNARVAAIISSHNQDINSPEPPPSSRRHEVEHHIAGHPPDLGLCRATRPPSATSLDLHHDNHRQRPAARAHRAHPKQPRSGPGSRPRPCSRSLRPSTAGTRSRRRPLRLRRNLLRQSPRRVPR